MRAEQPGAKRPYPGTLGAAHSTEAYIGAGFEALSGLPVLAVVGIVTAMVVFARGSPLNVRCTS